jgi:beta-galactosidase
MRQEQNFKWDKLSLGTCYYPEHWDKSLWREDLQRMKENGIFTIRIAEFAWNKVEPREGEFTYEFFDEFLDVAEEEEMKVIFGTPTATPPVWLTEKYPEVLNCRIDGTLFYHGMRRHYNYNSPVYQELSARIVKKVAKHYGKRPCIVGWQIDNEINCEVDEFYSESDTKVFREFLKHKYGTLDALNEAWGTIVWNQTYTSWKEIYVPRTTIHNSTNPHQMLDYYRFISDSTLRFCKMQSDIIRKYKKPEDFITTNGLFGNMDNHKMENESLDVYTYDSYPNFAYCLCEDPKHATDLKDRKWSRNLTEVRSVCPHFGIMEQQSGANGWNTRMEAPAPKPGQVMLWAMQSIAHGADYVSFFRWRTATIGTEIYWHGILDYDNRDNRKLAEIKQIWKRTQAISEMTGAQYKAAFALVKDYDNVWDAQVDVWHERLIKDSEKEIFVASQINHTPMDILYLNDETQVEELSEYPVLIYPHALILTKKRAKVLKAYVKAGGTLIIGARTGQKDTNGRCPMTPMPGLLGNVSKSDVKEFTFVGPADDAVYMDWDGAVLETGIFNDILAATGEKARVLAKYTSNYYEGRPALIETTVGAGKVLHFGGTFTRDNTKAFLNYAGVLNLHQNVIELPKECELAVREKDGKTYLFVLNYSSSAQEINVKQRAVDLDTGEEVQGQIPLKPYETKVYRILN